MKRLRLTRRRQNISNILYTFHGQLTKNAHKKYMHWFSARRLWMFMRWKMSDCKMYVWWIHSAASQRKKYQQYFCFIYSIVLLLRKLLGLFPNAFPKRSVISGNNERTAVIERISRERRAEWMPTMQCESTLEQCAFVHSAYQPLIYTEVMKNVSKGIEIKYYYSMNNYMEIRRKSNFVKKVNCNELQICVLWQHTINSVQIWCCLLSP